MYDATGEPVFSNLPKKDSIVNQTDISDANSFETRLLPDDLKTTKDQTKVLHDTINSRYIDLAVGLITDNQGNLTNYGKANLVYPSGTVLFEGEPVKQIDGWHTFDPNVPDTGSDDILDINTYSTVQGVFNKGVGNAVEQVDNPATTTIYYYHDQPVDITFEDVTNGDANAPVLSNFTASKDLRVDLNSQYIPGKPHTTPKNNKNQKYGAYSYQADDNTYDASAINVDPSGTLKSSKSLNYADVLKAYTDNGYVLVSSDPDDLTYEVEDVYDNNRNLQHKKRVVKLVHRAIAHTDTKTATRTIHYVANTKDGKQLQDDTTQNVTLTSSTYYTDAVTGNRVNAKQDTNGDWIVDTENAAALPAITWTVNADKSTGLTTDDKNFAAITTPETITLSTDEAAKRGTDEGDWYLVSTDKNGEVSYGDPNSDTWNADTPNKIADGYLVYKQKAQYNIHYIDVNGVEGKTTYAPTDGHELTDHLVPNVGEGKGIFVGDTPDATNKLWSPADYEKAGYILVGLSDNAKGDLLGKQTLTHDVQDQYVYLKHAVKTITPNTPAGEVPKDPDGNPIVDPSDLHKEFHRTIFYKANTTDGQTLMGQTDQKTEFNGTIAYDVVTGKTTTPEIVKDVNGKDVQVATLKDGTITWDKQNDKFSAVNQPTIELKKGDKYATSDDMIGTWELVDGEAGEVDLTPASKNPDDKTLVYKQKAQYNIHYIDVNGVENKTTYAPTDGHELTDHLVPNVGEGKGIFVGDTPDATQKLWSPADYEKAGYVLVGLSDNAKGDLLGKQTLTKGVQDQYVYLKHAVKDITPNTPVEDVPKDPDGKRAIDPSDLHKEFTRTITFVANNDAKSPLKDAVPQKVEFDGHIYVDMVTGQTTTPETVKDANGKTTQVATTKTGHIEWNHDTQTMGEIVQKYITLNKGDKYATSDDMVGTWHWISGVANEITLKPTSDNPADLELVYEKNKSESIPNDGHDLPKVDVKEETKTFTRTVVYRGTKDGGVHFESVNGSPDGKNTYKQTTTFTRNIFSTTDKDGKTTILETTPWTAKDDTLGEVVSKTPSAVGYEVVDIEKVDAHKINPDKDNPDLGIVTVTYEATSTQPTVQPTEQPTSQPTVQPTEQPTSQPTVQPTEQPTSQPTAQPTAQPTEQPTSQPTAQPTEQPTSQPTVQPTEQPTSQPTAQPTEQPTSQPTAQPTEQPTSQPTEQPTSQPTAQPTEQPTSQPTAQPTVQPTEQPTSQPTAQPTEQPTSQPTVQPTEQPTSQPTAQPTEQPTSQPTAQPTAQPTEQPTSQPTAQPTAQPTEQPTSQPTAQPTAQPTEQPTSQPTAQPTEQPTSQPTAQPTEQPTAQPAIESNTQLPGEQKNEEPQPMTTQVTAKKGETSIVEPTNSSSTQPTTKQGAQQLPQTGNQKSSSLIGLGFAGLLSALGLTKVNKKRKD